MYNRKQELKVMKRAKVCEVEDEDENPQNEGRGECEESNDLKDSYDGKMHKNIEKDGDQSVLYSSQMDSLRASLHIVQCLYT